jgi:threonine synthase
VDVARGTGIIAPGATVAVAVTGNGLKAGDAIRDQLPD